MALGSIETYGSPARAISPPEIDTVVINVQIQPLAPGTPGKLLTDIARVILTDRRRSATRPTLPLGLAVSGRCRAVTSANRDCSS